eukprot:gene12624-12754_t
MRDFRQAHVGRLAPARASEPELPQTISTDEALQILGLKTGETSFEQILTAKNKQLQANQSNQDRLMEIEAAYDVLFMQSMKKRITGELEVSSSVRYADVPTTRKRPNQRGTSPQSSLLQKLPGPGISVGPPKENVAAGQAAVFAGLATWAVVQAVLESPDAQAADTAGLQLAAALAFSVYGFREYKKLPLGRSFGLAIGSLFAGILIGAALNAWLRVDIVPIGGFGSPGVLVSTFGIVTVAVASAFLA